MAEVLTKSILFEYWTEAKKDALYTSPYNASASVI